MKVQTKLTIFILAALFIFGWQFVDICQVKAQRMATNPLLEEERKLRNELEQDTSIVQIPCRKTTNAINNQAKLSLYKAAASKESVVKAKKLCSTKEGTIIASYLLVNKGQITMVVDYSRDEFSSGRVYSETCDSLTFGSYVWIKDEKGARYEFQPASEKDKDNVTFMLRCEKMQNNTGQEKVF